MSPPKIKFPTLFLQEDDKKKAYSSWRLHRLQSDVYFKTYEIVENEVKQRQFLMCLMAESFSVAKKSFEDGEEEMGYDEFQE